MNKFSQFCADLVKHTDLKPLIYTSPASGYRARSEFGFSKDSYTMIRDGRKVFMNSYDITHLSIQKVMNELLLLIRSNDIIKQKLFQVNFRTSGTNVLASLIYHRQLDDDWIA